MKAIGKELGVRGYYKLIMVELTHSLKAARLVEQKNNIFDEPIPNDHTPVLQPTPLRPSNVTTKDKQNIKQKIKEFSEWLLNYIPPKPKWLTKCLSILKTKLKQYTKRGILCFNQHSPNLL